MENLKKKNINRFSETKLKNTHWPSGWLFHNIPTGTMRSRHLPGFRMTPSLHPRGKPVMCYGVVGYNGMTCAISQILCFHGIYDYLLDHCSQWFLRMLLRLLEILCQNPTARRSAGAEIPPITTSAILQDGMTPCIPDRAVCAAVCQYRKSE